MTKRLSPNKTGSEKKSLTDAEIRTDRVMPRRRLFPLFGGGLVGATLLVSNNRQALALTDGDNPSYGAADPECQGRGGGTGATDSDGGAQTDQPGRGRGGGGPVTDTDGGPSADQVNAGRGYSGLTDSDTGCHSDEAGRGRG